MSFESKLKGSGMLADFLQEAQRFVLTNILTLESTPLQVYSSVLAFTPKNSAVRTAFFQDDQIPKWISHAPEPEDNWDQCQKILECHTDLVTSVAFSHDSTLVPPPLMMRPSGSGASTMAPAFTRLGRD
ncbi:hypothetical protein EDB81DRAFT_751477 [Dactylonectria macrodidyma]|uniref:Uncharacterized protein n=1 Tax=Dactylonectria macrodidyma TaxID=307937 RepID=A0A9P9FU79_9HYPO|nr:hypothetical protein EDB81DRAFT_751477 [Dactylonectria macrodidyma]